jgi:hypothetical protein
MAVTVTTENGRQAGKLPTTFTYYLYVHCYVGYTAITILALLNRNTIFGTMVTLSFSIAK